MKRFTTLLVLICSTAAGVAEDVRSAAQGLAGPLIDRGFIVGMSIAVIRDGRVTELHLGRTRAGGDDSPTSQTLYEIGSITKTMTATLLADAVARGEMKLDDPIGGYLPGGVWPPGDGRDGVQLVHLATHTSGLPRMPGNFRPADPHNPYVDYTQGKLFAFLPTVTLSRQPGQRYAYSNLATGLLGQIVARRAGMSYEQLLAERLLEPLGMSDTRITLNDDRRARLATGHNGDGTPVANWDLAGLAGAGGVRSTLADMIRFAKANLDPDATPLGGAITETHEPRFPTGDGRQVALGWHLARDGVTRVHNGRTGGYSAILYFHRPAKTAVVLLSNTASDYADALGERIFQRAFGIELPLNLPLEPVRLTDEQLDRCVGRFVVSPAFAITIRRESDGLTARATGQDAFRIYPASPSEFFYRVVAARITFEFGEDGRAGKMTLHQFGRELPGVRMDPPGESD